MKTLITSAILVLNSIFINSQTTTLIKNVNVRAQELHHALSASKDTLILKGERTIYKVNIFNDSFEKLVEVNSERANIALSELPIGRFIIEATLQDKLIIMTLVRANKTLTESISQNTYPNGLTYGSSKNYSEQQLLKYSGSVNSSSLFPKFADVNALKRIPRSYWVEYVISNGNSSYKTFRFATKELVERMIEKNKIEVQSVKGKLNNLTVWEIYDTTKFVRFKRINPNFSQATESEFFNVSPYYASKDYLAGI